MQDKKYIKMMANCNHRIMLMITHAINGEEEYVDGLRFNRTT